MHQLESDRLHLNCPPERSIVIHSLGGSGLFNQLASILAAAFVAGTMLNKTLCVQNFLPSYNSKATIGIHEVLNISRLNQTHPTIRVTSISPSDTTPCLCIKSTSTDCNASGVIKTDTITFSNHSLVKKDEFVINYVVSNYAQCKERLCLNSGVITSMFEYSFKLYRSAPNFKYIWNTLPFNNEFAVEADVVLRNIRLRSADQMEYNSVHLRLEDDWQHHIYSKYRATSLRRNFTSVSEAQFNSHIQEDF